MITCTRRLQFCAGHRVFLHEGHCAHLHGHNYVALFTAQAEQLDSVGRVIDFSVLKEKLGKWIDANWDHGFVYFEQDTELAEMFKFNRWKSFKLKTNPTAENMASFLLNDVCPSLFKGTGVRVVKVKLWETENCYAEASNG
jgi:6-pyruvoyltetrahydropterin/6-carboxytetrahydropterin synthase